MLYHRGTPANNNQTLAQSINPLAGCYGAGRAGPGASPSHLRTGAAISETASLDLAQTNKCMNPREWLAEVRRLLEQSEFGMELMQRDERHWLAYCADGLSPEEAILAQGY